jgi:AraC-like DNA-binding protein
MRSLRVDLNQPNQIPESAQACRNRSLPLQARIGKQDMICNRNSACLVNPEDPFQLLLPHNTTIYAVSVFESSLCNDTSMLAGSTPLRLPNQFPLATAAGLAFRRHLAFLWSEIQCNSPILASDTVVEGFGRMLLMSVQLAANGGLPLDTKSAPPAYLHRVVDFIMAHLSRPLSINEIAAVAGVHARTLHKSFCQHFGESVTAFIQHQRLERVQRQLREADPQSTSVTDAAIENGFFHLSRFAAAYRCRFGEYPSETLRC